MTSVQTRLSEMEELSAHSSDCADLAKDVSISNVMTTAPVRPIDASFTTSSNG